MKLVKINTELAVRYMGCAGRDVSSLLPLIDKCEKRLIENARPNFIIKYFKVLHDEAGILLEGTDLLLTGRSISDHLNGCSGCFLLCATLSAAADRLIRNLAVEDIAASYVIDCLASAAIEDVCDAAEQEMVRLLPDKFFTWRYSPGYGDLPLEIQSKLIRIMDAEKRIGLSVTDSDIMIPSKSVTAIIGVSDVPLPKAERSCLGCNMYDNCSFRKGGDHCGSQSTVSE